MSIAPSPLALFRRARLPLVLMTCLWLVGCDQLGLESATAVAAKREADGKAVGAGCRHAARSIEQCFESNKRADRAAVFAGWREMEDYMRENKIEAVPAQVEPVSTKAEEDAAAEEGGGKSGKAGKGEKAERTEKADPAEKSAAAKPASKSGT